MNTTINPTPTFINILRIWLALVAVMAFGNTIQCFISSNYLFERLYTINEKNVSGLAARLFGVWTLMSGVVRILCAFFIYNKTLYFSTLVSFIIALAHFTSEVFIFNTAALTIGIIAPLIVSSLSILMMLFGFRYIEEEDPRMKYVNENEELLKSKNFMKTKKLS
ncbi:ergosterol biosynthetic protein 28 [Biomphalaria glabrata]|uniref:Ergosterol biosynthetic protein 28 n=1 Tax=Biomphalaria glabrata TaxID=6526 RepID=A0A2C9L1H4_BIOGL|nr:ergosterol biosynthetic protein 28 [Biomphalaria glabrata]